MDSFEVIVKEAFPPVVIVEDPFTDVVLGVLSVSKVRVENSKGALGAAYAAFSNVEEARLGSLDHP